MTAALTARIAKPPAIVTDPAARAAQVAALYHDYPGWHARASDEGMIYAGVARICQRGKPWASGSTLVAGNPGEMRSLIAAQIAANCQPVPAIAAPAGRFGSRGRHARPGRAARRAAAARAEAFDDVTVELFHGINAGINAGRAGTRLLWSVRDMATALLVLGAITARRPVKDELPPGVRPLHPAIRASLRAAGFPDLATVEEHMESITLQVVAGA